MERVLQDKMQPEEETVVVPDEEGSDLKGISSDYNRFPKEI